MHPDAIIPGKPYALPVTARFLYGAPAAGLTGQAQMRLVIDPAPFPALAGYRIGLIDETYAPDAKDLPVPDTDAQGHSSVSIDIPRAPDTTHALKALAHRWGQRSVRPCLARHHRQSRCVRPAS